MRSRFKQLAGFTMIELLVVIAVIGILAVATLSAINPIEQINKGRDTRTRSDAAEILGAIERYYSTQETYPWNDTADAATATYDWTAVAQVGTAVTFNGAAALTGFGWVGNLIKSQEIKSQFGTRLYQAYNTQTNPNFAVVKAAAAGNESQQVYVCFIPVSQQFKIEASRKCCADAATTGVCANAGDIKNTAPAAADANGLVVCPDTAGDAAADNYLCLP